MDINDACFSDQFEASHESLGTRIEMLLEVYLEEERLKAY